MLIVMNLQPSHISYSLLQDVLQSVTQGNLNEVFSIYFSPSGFTSICVNNETNLCFLWNMEFTYKEQFLPTSLIPLLLLQYFYLVRFLFFYLFIYLFILFTSKLQEFFLNNKIFLFSKVLQRSFPIFTTEKLFCQVFGWSNIFSNLNVIQFEFSLSTETLMSESMTKSRFLFEIVSGLIF